MEPALIWGALIFRIIMVSYLTHHVVGSYLIFVKTMSKQLLYVVLFCLLLGACKNETEMIDTIIINGSIATLDSNMTLVEAMALKDGSIYKIGSNAAIKALATAETKIIDAQGNFVMPGLIDGHAHFLGLGKTMLRINLLGTSSWEEVLSEVADSAKNKAAGQWLEGRGWHQEKWDSLPEGNLYGHPTHFALSEISPNNPVVLRHASGHALIANAKAMEVAGVNLETPELTGGKILRFPDGSPTGIFEENAMSLILNALNASEQNRSQQQIDAYQDEALQKVIGACLSNGITGFHDAGMTFDEATYLLDKAQNNELPVRVNAMAYTALSDLKANASQFTSGNSFFKLKAVKQYMDGALGSHGALLFHPYVDRPNMTGQQVEKTDLLEKYATFCKENGLQFCVHAIGDKANHDVLNLFERTFNNTSELQNQRWRIEHVQHLDPKDYPRFKELGVLACMQAIHCTSDAPYVAKRIGDERAANGAYAWRSLIDHGATIVNGTDAPVEAINPFECLYASVTRKRIDGMEFYPEQKMTRIEALKSYTINNAYASFEEKEKGTIEEGKLADVIILDKNLLTCTDEEILQTKVLYTIVDGKIRYQDN